MATKASRTKCCCHPALEDGESACRRTVRALLVSSSRATAKGSGLVVKLPKQRVAELIDAGVGEPFAPAGKTFKEWLAVPRPDRRLWRELLREGVEFVAR